ncbi:hypothetical protein [Commensalibacter oyaizuii]|uniref:Uncharacterized protein n=1 Tax=Commensalibacter oyaizuii TaxID=3043873 RepID=A0ABT6Q430_9PROT|nr:hypothetical protein [Commensalibacter sp. TBRC 16381]MDI2091780.1 hypothetical protein [Commensalibacter sp. TBRC 16381]
MSQETINSVIKQFATNVCTSSIILAAESMHKCYEYIDKNSPDIDQCILADMYLQDGLTHLRQREQDLGRSSPTDDIPYIEPETSRKRIKEYLSLPRFSSLQTQSAKEAYFKHGIDKVEQGIFGQCKITDYKYGSSTKWNGQVKNPEQLDDPSDSN